MPKVYDAVIFSVELDMLEIRLRELWDVVDKFVILESNATFTGLLKEESFKVNRERFAFAESKIVYKSIPLFPLERGQEAWYNEGKMRDGMTHFLMEAGIQRGDLVTFSDVDEIVSGRAIELLKACQGAPESLHLMTRNYLYSYEFPVGDEGMWRTSIHSWSPGKSRYAHHQTSDSVLTDAGMIIFVPHFSRSISWLGDHNQKRPHRPFVDRSNSSRVALLCSPMNTNGIVFHIVP